MCLNRWQRRTRYLWNDLEIASCFHDVFLSNANLLCETCLILSLVKERANNKSKCHETGILPLF